MGLRKRMNQIIVMTQRYFRILILAFYNNLVAKYVFIKS